jgi:hypothetical protein
MNFETNFSQQTQQTEMVYDHISRLIVNKDTKKSFLDRSMFTEDYAWAIPSREAVGSIVEFAGSKRIVEVGSGLGLWAGLIKATGGSIIPTDSFVSHGISGGRYAPVERIDGVDAINKYRPEILMICWPGYDEPFAANVLEAFEALGNPDAKLIYIGEGWGGCTGDDRFFSMLGRSWEQVKEVEIPQWWGIHDQLYMYKRKA